MKKEMLDILNGILDSCPPIALITSQRRRISDDKWVIKSAVALAWPAISAAGAVLGVWLTLHDDVLVMKQTISEVQRNTTAVVSQQSKTLDEHEARLRQQEILVAGIIAKSKRQ